MGDGAAGPPAAAMGDGAAEPPAGGGDPECVLDEVRALGRAVAQVQEQLSAQLSLLCGLSARPQPPTPTPTSPRRSGVFSSGSPPPPPAGPWPSRRVSNFSADSQATPPPPPDGPCPSRRVSLFSADSLATSGPQSNILL